MNTYYHILVFEMFNFFLSRIKKTVLYYQNNCFHCYPIRVNTLYIILSIYKILSIFECYTAIIIIIVRSKITSDGLGLIVVSMAHMDYAIQGI